MMQGSSGYSVAHQRSRAQTLFIAASCSNSASQPSSKALKRQKTLSLSAGAAVPLRRPSADSQKRDALTLEAPLADAAPQLEDMDFDDFVAESDVPILVDFYAPWCGPCQLMSKVVTDISQELMGRMKVVKINTDAYPRLASKYRIKGLPTCLLFRDGSVIDRVDGFMPESVFGKRVRFYVSRLDTKFGRR